MSDPAPADPRPPLLELSVPAPPHGEEVLLVDALWRVGARAVEGRGARYVALLPAPHDADATLRDVRLAIRASTSLREPELAWRWVSHEEWRERWHAQQPPRAVGHRFVVAPRDAAPEPRPGTLVIRLAPGLGFGTAEHATTRMCLRLLERFVQPGDRVADVGTGSGILAIAAALLGASSVLALEVDAHACAAARENLRANGVQDRVHLRRVEVGADTLERGAFGGVAANLQLDPLVSLLPGLAGALAGGGWLVASGVPHAERAAVLHAARSAGLQLDADLVEEGWWAVALRRA